MGAFGVCGQAGGSCPLTYAQPVRLLLRPAPQASSSRVPQSGHHLPGPGTCPRCLLHSALPGIRHPEKAEEAVVHGVGGFLGGHPPGLDLVFGGAA